MTRLSFMGATLVCLSVLGCGVDEVPDGLKRTPRCDGDACGASVRFDLYHKPLPEIPLPNDAAMWPDPTSRTGLRINASVVAPTNIEHEAREKFDTLEGWGTYAPITVAFDRTQADGRAAIDLQNVVARHQGDDYELDNDVIYVVNLETGVPAIVDIGEGAFQYVVREKARYWRNDTRRFEQNLMWDTADETIDPATGKRDAARLSGGVPIYDPRWDTDFDGVIDMPNLLDPDACPTQVDVANGTTPEVVRDQCVADQLLTFYERETDTLIMRPLVPLEEKTQYAVVITDRLLDADGNPVRSPFDFVYHPAQENAVARLQSHLSNEELASYYGDIGGSGLEHVVFAWTFTTQPVTEDLRVIRDGLYGKGPLARLAKQYPAELTAARAAGKVSLEAIAEGAEEPANWQSDPKCAEVVKTWHIVNFDVVKNTIKTLAEQGFGFEGPTLTALVESFDAIDHVLIGTFQTPFFISGGPKGTDPNASFNMDFSTGEGELTTDTVQVMITVPKQTETRKQPFPVAYYGHGYTSSSLESLGFGGWLASQGIASVGMNAVFHGLELGELEKTLAQSLFSGACQGPFGSALLEHRARDLDGDGAHDSGGDYWTSYLFHTRDVVRQSAVDLLQMFRIFKSFDGERISQQDLNNNGAFDDLAGDFDGNGVPDIGGPNTEFYAWGQSLGGILAPFVAALDPQVVAAAPTAGSGGLLDVGARTFQGGAFEGIYLRNFGPIVVGVPASELDPKNTKCSPEQVSLRFVVISVNDDVEAEFSCIDKSLIAQSGGTVLVYNGGNGESRCARMDTEGRFRIGMPASVLDRLELQIFDEPDAVDSYDGTTGCNITVGEERRVALIQTWGEGLIPQNAKDETGEKVLCTHERGCTKFQNDYIEFGTPLFAIAEGFGHIRQTPSLRRFMSLASNVIDPGDPVNYAPFFGIRPIADPDGNPHPSTGVLNIVTIGDMNVPLSSGIALGRAAGAVPFLRPDAINRYPALADYVTPTALYSSLGKTPHRILIEKHVMEGINRLERHPPPPGTCQRNEVPLTVEDTVCHANCTPGDDSSCLDNQICNDQGRCVGAPVDDADCRQYLYDVDVLDESLARYGEEEAANPLRLARVATPASAENLEQLWAPRLSGKPYSDSDSGAWQADQRVVGQLQAYIEPKGVHGFEPSRPCESWDSGLYMINLIARFFTTSGSDVYYLSHPATHQCLAKPFGAGACPFVVIPD